MLEILSPKVKIQQLRAPTWSWAAVDGEVEREYGNEDPYYKFRAHLRDIHMAFSGQDPFGEVDDRALTLACSALASGKITRANIVKSGQERLYCNVKIKTKHGRRELFTITSDYVLPDSINSSKIVYLLPLLEIEMKTRLVVLQSEWRECLKIKGIVLQPNEGSLGRYRRIGFFSHEWRGGEEDKSDEYYRFLKVLEQSGTATAKAAYTEVIENKERPDERFVITIV